MDIFNFPKTIEQGIYDMMLWIFFFPYTLARMVFRPVRMLRYVEEQSGADPDVAFSSAMRPALLLFLAISLGSLLAPLPADAVAHIQQFHLGKAVTETWFGLLAWRMMVYSFFALVGALLFDLLTPGSITRDTLRRPFNQQCYICAPFALVLVPLLVLDSTDSSALFDWVAAVIAAWFLFAQFLFFRQFMKAGIWMCMGLAVVVLAAGIGWMILTAQALTIL